MKAKTSEPQHNISIETGIDQIGTVYKVRKGNRYQETWFKILLRYQINILLYEYILRYCKDTLTLISERFLRQILSLI